MSHYTGSKRRCDSEFLQQEEHDASEAKRIKMEDNGAWQSALLNDQGNPHIIVGAVDTQLENSAGRGTEGWTDTDTNIGNISEDTSSIANSEFPRLPVYHPSFEKAETLSQKPIGILIKAIEEHRHKPKEIQDFLSNLKGSKPLNYSRPKTIGFLGPTGSGQQLPEFSLFGSINYRQASRHL